MARIKLKLGENEIEVDSRDFYVDNQTLGEIIANICTHKKQLVDILPFAMPALKKKNLVESK